MSSAAMRRLAGERRRLESSAPNGITASVRDNFHWDATVRGPESTPWEGSTLCLELHFPADYPFKPPAVRFVTPMRHPNVYPDGSVCVDLLGAAWAPACDVSSILMTLQLLLSQPNPDSPADPEAADVFRAGGMGGLARINNAALSR